MSLIAKEESNSKFKPVPPGLHLARCYRIIDLGTQKVVWQGTEKYQHKIMVQFEIHGEDEEGMPLVTEKGEPMSISKNYTLSLNENASLSKDLESWRGSAFTKDERKGFELSKLLGVWSYIAVSKALGHDGKEYTNISNLNPVPANIKKAGYPEPHNEAKIFSISNPDMELFESFGQKLKEKIGASPEWQQKSGKVIQSQSDPFDGLEDEPF